MRLGKAFLFLFLFIELATSSSCTKDNNKAESIVIGADMIAFEIKYNELAEVTLGNQTVKLFIKNVVDSVIVDCSLTDFFDPSGPNKIRANAYLTINAGKSLVKLTSKPCGTILYKNDGSDLQDVVNIINNIKVY